MPITTPKELCISILSKLRNAIDNLTSRMQYRKLCTPLLLFVCYGGVAHSHQQSRLLEGARKILSYRVNLQQDSRSQANGKVSGLLVLSFARDARETANFDPILGITPTSGYGDFAERGIELTPGYGIKSCDLKIQTVSLAFKDGAVLTRTATFSLNRKNNNYEGGFQTVYSDEHGKTVQQEKGHVIVNVLSVSVFEYSPK
jgi:hypothetical protein